MKDWIEILIGVVVFGVLIFVHVIDHIIAFKKMLDKRKADAGTAGLPPLEIDPSQEAPAPMPRSLPPVQPAAMPMPASIMPPKPPREKPRRRAQSNDAPPRAEMPVLAAPAVTQRRSSSVVPLLREMLKDRTNLASAIILQEIFGPPKCKR
jgi:hypothetical protein